MQKTVIVLFIVRAELYIGLIMGSIQLMEVVTYSGVMTYDKLLIAL